MSDNAARRSLLSSSDTWSLRVKLSSSCCRLFASCYRRRDDRKIKRMHPQDLKFNEYRILIINYTANLCQKIHVRNLLHAYLEKTRIKLPVSWHTTCDWCSNKSQDMIQVLFQDQCKRNENHDQQKWEERFWGETIEISGNSSWQYLEVVCIRSQKLQRKSSNHTFSNNN